MSTSRTYGDACAIARALDILGERWALMTVRELLLGPKRFTDLRDGLPNASPYILSMRLRDLEAHGLVRKRRLPPPAASQVYELTARGQEIAPVLDALGTCRPHPHWKMSPRSRATTSPSSHSALDRSNSPARIKISASQYMAST